MLRITQRRESASAIRPTALLRPAVAHPISGHDGGAPLFGDPYGVCHDAGFTTTTPRARSGPATPNRWQRGPAARVPRGGRRTRVVRLNIIAWPADALGMRRLLVLTVLAVLAGGCAAPSSTSDDATASGAANAHAVDDRPGEDGAEVAGSAHGDGRSDASPLGRGDDVGGDDRTPDLLGADLDTVRTVLADVGAAGLHVLAFESEAPVTAQYPTAGESLPAGDPVLVWLGTPPEPPPPEEPVMATTAPDSGPAEDGDADRASSQEEQAALDDAEASEASRPGSTEAGGADDAEGDVERSSDGRRTAPAPSAGRTSPRDQPASDPGTSLRGPASWYGPGFEGRTTACGGRFDPGELTFASR